jgi:hypothetical protein
VRHNYAEGFTKALKLFLVPFDGIQLFETESGIVQAFHEQREVFGHGSSSRSIWIICGVHGCGILILSSPV